MNYINREHQAAQYIVEDLAAKVEKEKEKEVWTDRIFDFSLSMCEKTIKDIFGEKLGQHLSDKYYDGGKNWLRWYGSLDYGNREKLIEYIEKNH